MEGQETVLQGACDGSISSCRKNLCSAYWLEPKCCDICHVVYKRKVALKDYLTNSGGVYSPWRLEFREDRCTQALAAGSECLVCHMWAWVSSCTPFGDLAMAWNLWSDRKSSKTISNRTWEEVRQEREQMRTNEKKISTLKPTNEDCRIHCLLKFTVAVENFFHQQVVTIS